MPEEQIFPDYCCSRLYEELCEENALVARELMKMSVYLKYKKEGRMCTKGIIFCPFCGKEILFSDEAKKRSIPNSV